jgi:hypothetical protein
VAIKSVFEQEELCGSIVNNSGATTQFW